MTKTQLTTFGHAAGPACAVVLPLLLVGTCATGGAGGRDAPGGGAVLPSRVLYAGSHCGREEPGPALAWIEEAGELRRAFGRLGVASLAQQAPAVDFERHGVLLIAMGQRRTAGYGVTPQDGGVRLAEGTLEVRVRWTEPQPGAMTAQVLTSPCCMLEVPRAGFSRVRVVDTEGRVRVERELP